MLNPTSKALLGALLAISMVAIAGICLRPLFPVDETRYLTVAWEMFAHKEWILPTLNFEPYHHKPPLLFWSIMSLWSVFGASQAVAMLVPYLYLFALIAASIYLVKSLRPQDDNAPIWTAGLLIGSLPIMIFGNLVMFDVLLSIFAILGLASIWNFAQTGKYKHLLIYIIAVGLGGLAKGPVILLNLLFPIILVRFWTSPDQRPHYFKWAASFLIATLLGASITLSWAIPAAIKGGPEFAEKIFWGQTAGRMTKAFDHARPVWWYVPFIPLLLFPWIANPTLWTKLRGWAETSIYLPQNVIRFLLCWVIPVFVSFSLISGKQVHYLIPTVIGALIFVGVVLSEGRDITKLTTRTAVAMTIFIIGVHIVGHNTLYKRYDLTTMGAEISKYNDHPMAFVRNYHGEWGFMAKVERPVKQILPEELPSWFKANPNGIAFFRTSDENEFRGIYDVIYEMPYKTTNTFAIIVPKGMGKNFVQPQQ